jgi:hypothetical protein
VLSLKDPDIIAVTETQLTSDIPDAEITLEGYTVFRIDQHNTVEEGFYYMSEAH